MAHSQTAAFLRRVREHMQVPPVVVPGGLPALETVARMTEAGASAAVILAADGRVAGILTEQDVTRRIAGRQVGARPIADLMTRPVATIGADQPLYEAIGFMRRLGLRHMPVVDDTDGLCGMLYLHDALAGADPSLVEHINRLTHETTLEGLREVKAAQVRLAADLFADRVPAPEIQNLISCINNDIHRRVMQLNVDAMQAERWGAPPIAFAVIVMGSGGRAARAFVSRPGQRLHPRRLSRSRSRAHRYVLCRARPALDHADGSAELPAVPRWCHGDQSGVAQDQSAVAAPGHPLDPGHSESAMQLSMTAFASSTCGRRRMARPASSAGFLEGIARCARRGRSDIEEDQAPPHHERCGENCGFST